MAETPKISLDGRSGDLRRRLAAAELHRLPETVPGEAAAVDPARVVEAEVDALDRRHVGLVRERLGEGREPALVDHRVVVDRRHQLAPGGGEGEVVGGREAGVGGQAEDPVGEGEDRPVELHALGDDHDLETVAALPAERFEAALEPRTAAEGRNHGTDFGFTSGLRA